MSAAAAVVVAVSAGLGSTASSPSNLKLDSVKADLSGSNLLISFRIWATVNPASFIFCTSACFDPNVPAVSQA